MITIRSRRLSACTGVATEIEEHWGGLVGYDRFNEVCYLLDGLLKQLEAQRDR
ncbi:hypothetical protein [Mycobacterium sp.]|uniref:hypothetical protein n=1 Tax=Mycobacterium sp. TaxID=1785 RepID=UPI003C77B9A1